MQFYATLPFSTHYLLMLIAWHFTTGYACSERCTLGFIPTWHRGVGYIILPASQLYRMSQHIQWSPAFMSHNIKPAFTEGDHFSCTTHEGSPRMRSKYFIYTIPTAWNTQHHPAKAPLLLTATYFCNIFHWVVLKLFTPVNQLTARCHCDVERQGIAVGNL